MGMIMSAIMLPDSWMDRLLAKVQLADEVERVARERKKVENKLRKLGQVYLNDDLMEYEDYKSRKRKLEDELSSLVVPGIDAVQAAGELLEDIPHLWEKADLTERRKMLMTMLEAVYVECKEEKRIVGIKPKPAFKPLFEIVLTKDESGVVLVKDDEEEEGPDSGNPAKPSNMPINPGSGDNHGAHNKGIVKNPCSWWRRGRVELHPTRGIYVRLAA
jgi:hypothetical protein